MARTSLVVGLAISTVVFAVMSYEGHGGGVLGGVLLEVLLITFVQQGLDRTERVGFSIAAVSLGLLALVVGRFADRLSA
jgi:uncharacterized membrane protein